MDVIDSANFHAEVNTELLDRLLIHGDNEKAIRKIVGKVLQSARKNVSKNAKGALKNDPRQAYRAVKHTIYRSIIGGNISILAKRSTGRREAPPSSRRGRSKRTEDLLSYWGSDRGFILRFLNTGTGNRVAVNMNNHPIIREINDRPRKRNGYKSGQVGYRGNITAGNWFANSSHNAMRQASIELAQLVEQEIANYFNKK